MRRFIAKADTELWYLQRDGNTLPIYACLGTLNDVECWYVSPAAVLPATPFGFLKAILDDLAFHKKDSKWFLKLEMLEANFIKARGITPEYYLQWQGKPVSEAQPQREGATKSIDHEFVLYCCRKKGLPDAATAQRHYWAFCECAMEWLVDEHQPINMGFARIHAMPYRHNWMHIIATKFPGLGKVLSMPKEQRDATLIAMDFDAHLLSANLVEINNPSQTFGWTLHMEPSNAWNEYTQDYETAAILENTPETYATRWAVLARRLRTAAIGLLEAFFRSVRLPNAVVDQRAPEGSRRFVPATQGRVRPTAPPLPIARAVFASVEDPVAPQEGDADAIQIEGMQEVPDAEFKLEYLR